MGLISELRHPSTWYAKLLAATFSLLCFAFLATGTISGFLVYRIISPVQTRESLNTKDFPGHLETLEFTVPGVGPREGWFFPGLKGAPTVLLCHGYQSNRGELLTLVTALQDNQFNVFLFDFAAHGSSRGYTTFGYREAAELRAAIDTVARRDDVDPRRIGLWGTNLGAYAALSEAEHDPRVRAIVLDSVYDRPTEMVRLLIQHSGLGALPLIGRWAELCFTWIYPSYRHALPLSAGLPTLAGVPKLFLSASDEPELALSTRELFARAPEPREQAMLTKGGYANMLDDEKRSYENRIVSFFLLRLPPGGKPRH